LFCLVHMDIQPKVEHIAPRACQFLFQFYSAIAVFLHVGTCLVCNQRPAHVAMVPCGHQFVDLLPQVPPGIPPLPVCPKGECVYVGTCRHNCANTNQVRPQHISC
jgi:hypothetical protein